MSGPSLEKTSHGVLRVRLQDEEHDSPVTEDILSAGRSHITLKAHVRKEHDFAQSEGIRDKLILRGGMKISRVKQQQQMFENIYSAGRKESNMTCIFNCLWLTETEVWQCISVLVLLSLLAENPNNGRRVPLGSTALTCRHIVR
jgi:hypothetical protein